MSNQNLGIVRRAVTLFKEGDFKQAKSLYQQAADQYGSQLFANNIRLCELRMAQPAVNQKRVKPREPNGNASGDTSELSRQLDETQKLLEYYYTRAREMEYQLMDRKQS